MVNLMKIKGEACKEFSLILNRIDDAGVDHCGRLLRGYLLFLVPPCGRLNLATTGRSAAGKLLSYTARR